MNILMLNKLNKRMMNKLNKCMLNKLNKRMLFSGFGLLGETFLAIVKQKHFNKSLEFFLSTIKLQPFECYNLPSNHTQWLHNQHRTIPKEMMTMASVRIYMAREINQNPVWDNAVIYGLTDCNSKYHLWSIIKFRYLWESNLLTHR